MQIRLYGFEDFRQAINKIAALQIFRRSRFSTSAVLTLAQQETV